MQLQEENVVQRNGSCTEGFPIGREYKEEEIMAGEGMTGMTKGIELHSVLMGPVYTDILDVGPDHQEGSGATGENATMTAKEDVRGGDEAMQGRRGGLQEVREDARIVMQRKITHRMARSTKRFVSLFLKSSIG